jgi:hypothetical protein
MVAHCTRRPSLLSVPLSGQPRRCAVLQVVVVLKAMGIETDQELTQLVGLESVRLHASMQVARCQYVSCCSGAVAYTIGIDPSLTAQGRWESPAALYRALCGAEIFERARGFAGGVLPPPCAYPGKHDASFSPPSVGACASMCRTRVLGPFTVSCACRRRRSRIVDRRCGRDSGARRGSQSRRKH